VAAPLLGLASLLGREYAYTRPTYKEQDDILKVVSPQTYYGNQLINYLTDKFGVHSSLPSAQNTIENASRRLYNNGPQGISDEEYDRQMADIRERTSTPEYKDRFENTLRDETYGTIDPAVSYYVGPDAADSERSRLNELMLPRKLESLPVESNFTPAQLDALRERIYGVTPEVGPQQQEAPFVMPGPGGEYMPQGAGGDFMPQGGGKDAFSASMYDVEQYLRGGVVGRRRA
jgi:hypothetical protein